MEAISEALARLMRRQDDLEARFRQMEVILGFTNPIAPPAVPPPLPPAPLPAPQAQPSLETHLETQVGLNWINRIAVVTLIFGTAFLFKYAVDTDWIGPGARIALAVTAALASLWFGDRLWAREQKVFAQGLTGLGLALLFLSCYASFAFYHLLPQSAAFLLMVASTVAGGALALRYDSQAIAILGLMGGYLTPVVLSTGQDHPWVLFSYTSLLNIAALALMRVRAWRAVEYVAVVATGLLYAGWFATWFSDRTRQVATVFAVLFFAQFATAEARGVVLCTQLLASLAAAAIWKQPSQFLPLTLLFAAAGLVVAELRRWRETPAWTLLCFWAPYAAWVAQSFTSPDRGATFGLLTAGFGLFFLWILWWGVWRSRTLRSTDLLVMAGNAAAYFAASYALLNAVYRDYMGFLSAAVGAVHLLAAKLLWTPEASAEEDLRPAQFTAALTLTFLTLAIPIQFNGFRITIAWALEGAALAWLASRFDSLKFSTAAWLVFALVLGRLFTLDAWIYADGNLFMAIVNARFLTFLVSAIALWLAAKFARPAAPAAAAYVGGHLVMLWILGLEVIGWAERSFPPNDLSSVETTAISILMAIYALALVGLGVVTRTVINRVLGLGLMGIVVAKLYLSDVWQLGRGFRILAFLGLGLLLLVVSYLYSRFKPMIERLWRNDPG